MSVAYCAQVLNPSIALTCSLVNTASFLKSCTLIGIVWQSTLKFSKLEEGSVVEFADVGESDV